MRIPVLLALVFVTCAHADSASDRDLLKGITEVKVIIEEVSPELQSDGLSEDQLRTDIELKLRGANIPIVSEDRVGNRGAGFITLNITSIKNGVNYANFVELKVQNSVVSIQDLSRSSLRVVDNWPKGNISAEASLKYLVFVIEEYSALDEQSRMATVWSKGVLLTGGQRETASRIRGKVKDFVDSFLNDWLAANEPPLSAKPSK